MAKSRTMYMHTLDGRPASFRTNGVRLGAWLAFIGGRNKVKLADSLHQICIEWNEAADACEVDNPGNPSAGVEYIQRCGYVLVEVPSSV